MLQKDHDPDGKRPPLPTRASAGKSRGSGVTDETERKAAAGASGEADLDDAASEDPRRSG